MANRKWAVSFTALAIVLLGSIGLFLLRRTPQSRIQELARPAYNVQRPGGGRLFQTPYAPPARVADTKADIGRAQILLLNMPESEPRLQDLQGLIDLANGDWERFRVLYPTLPDQRRAEAATLNNLGASFLGLAEQDPTYLVNAMDAFERAAAADPKAEEPLFNLVVTYRKLHFVARAEDTFRQYSTLDAGSAWHRELANPQKIDEAAIHDQLTVAADNHDQTELQRLFQANPELCRRIAMQFSIANEPESPALLRFIATQMETRYGDKTVSAMIEPLFGNEHEHNTTVAIRGYVNQGANLYKAGAYKESLAAYVQAERLLSRTSSVFDRLWIALNRADTQIKLGQFRAAREAILDVVSNARNNQLIWMVARALSMFGSTTKLTDSYAELLNQLSESDRTFAAIDAPHDRVRVLYYLAAYRHGAGDEESALRLALECLLLVDDERDATRLSTLDYLVGNILYRRGLHDRGLFFATESVEQGKHSPNAGVEAATSTVLAQLYESQSQNDRADQYIQIAEDAVLRMPDGLERRRAELSLDLTKAQLQVNQKKYKDAESLLQETLDIYSQQPFSATELLAQSLMLCARVYAETGRIDEAAKKFNEAIDVVENDDEYLKAEGLRVKFDDERRELYDSAIEFELHSGSLEAAWKYVQKYRAKVFLEFLAAFNPKFVRTRAKLDPHEVQQRMPKDSQIVEYVSLRDKLLIWVLTDKLFEMRSVDISRSVLEDKVQAALQILRNSNAANVDGVLADLGGILIGPVADLLDPGRVIAVIPDRALNGLPFEALRRPGKNQYLIEEFAIGVSSSLTHLLAGLSSVAPQRRDAIVAFGSQNGGASELKELNALSGIYNTKRLYSGRQVDKSTFLSEMNKAAIFHYAGHSVTDAVDPLRSSILLDGNRSGPNSVTAVDISQQRLSSDAVVILSSCDSAVGNSRDGIGVRGLTSAFLIGGASAVVGSLWPVEAASTADLMIRFHQVFATSGMPVAKALREAQLNFIHSYPERAHPYYWSGFVVTGNFKALR